MAQPPPSYESSQLPPSYGQSQAYPSEPNVGFRTDYGQFSKQEPGQAGTNAGFNAGQDSGYGYDQSFAQPQPYAATTTPAANTTCATRMSDYPPSSAVGDCFDQASFSDKAIRRAFIRKVYLILTAQLLVTVGFIAFFIFVEPVKNWVQTDGLWFYLVAYGTFLVTYIALVCCPSVRRKSPGNFICLIVFTLAFSYMTGVISSYHDTNVVLLAAGVTAAVCLAVSIFAIQTKIDFTMCSGLLFALLMVLIFFGFATLITYYVWGPNRIMDSVYAGLGALVFALFLIYDTQMIMGGHKIELSPEEYIFGALQLYIDVVYIFLFLLSLFGKNN